MFKRSLLFLLILSLLIPSLTACKESTSETCPDGVCEIPTLDDNGNQVYPIVSPVGYHDVEMISQAPRLDTLNGKTIALVGGSFMASTTHKELESCIKEKYPDAKVLSFNTIPAAGPYSVFGQSEKTKAFQKKLEEYKVDAVISGNCGCGLCTTKECGSSIAAEYVGIPSVTVGAPTFIPQIHSTGVNRGVPVLRSAEYPGAFATHSDAELKKNAREILFPLIEKALTEPITEEEIALYANDGKRPYDEIVYYGNFEEIQEYCLANGWTDGLPVIPPTDEAIQSYLRFTPDPADKVLGTPAPAYRECTVYTVAANAVMAGVPAEFMPLCIAFVEALEDGEFRRPLSSTHGWTPFAWINGPVARQLGIDCAQGMISEENNKALGRFMDLALLNVGGYYVKENRMGSFGYLSPWTFSEDEEACLAMDWEPYHVSKGYGLHENVLTAASALTWGNNVTPATDDGEQIMKLLAWDITEKQQNGLGNTNPQVYRTVFITEQVAKNLALSYPSKSTLEDALIETARRPLFMRAYAHYWANTGSVQSDKRSLEEHYQMLLTDGEEGAMETETPDWLKGFVESDSIMTHATMKKGQTALLVTGDTDRNKFQVMPGGGYVSISIRLPDDWDELLAPLGYSPLSTYYLDDSPSADTPNQEESKEENAPSPNRGALPDGSYRIVPSAQQLTESGRAFKSSDGNLEFWASGKSASESIALSLLENGLGKIIRALGTNCSFTVTGGKLTELVIRPSAVGKKTETDLSSLTDDLLKNVKVTIAVNTRQSKEAGGVTPSGTTLIFSSSFSEFYLDMGGKIEFNDSDTPDFLTANGSLFARNPSAASGSQAKLTVKASGGVRRTLVFTQMKNGTLRVSYTSSDSSSSRPLAS